MVVDRNRLEVTPEQYDALSEDDHERFLTIKIQEAKILGDKDEFDLLEDKLYSLTSANEVLQSSAMQFLQKNTQYESDIASNSSLLPSQKISNERRYVADNEDYVTNIALRTSGIDDKIASIRQYISNARDIARNI